MAVGDKDLPAAVQDQGVLCQDGKVQHHLVHFRLTVASDTENLVCHGIQHGDDLLGRVIPGQVIPRPVIEDVAQQHQPVSA